MLESRLKKLSCNFKNEIENFRTQTEDSISDLIRNFYDANRSMIKELN